MKLKPQLIAAFFAAVTSIQVASAALQAPLPEFKSKAELQKTAPAKQTAETITDNKAFYTGKPYEAERERYLFKSLS